MRIMEIVESKVWQHVDGRTASIYGAVPYSSDADKANWKVVTRGYTWALDNGTVGLCRVPAKTLEEAQEVMDRHNARFKR